MSVALLGPVNGFDAGMRYPIVGVLPLPVENVLVLAPSVHAIE
jgi:hypothetical protein